MKKISLALFFLLKITFCSAQSIDSAGLKHLHVLEDSLKNLGKKFGTGNEDVQRINANYTFIKTLVSALKTPGSYHYAFDSLKNISIINSPDDRFRLLTWHIADETGVYTFYGAIQLNSASLQLFPLQDYSTSLSNPEDSVTDNRKWFGAQYYKIIQPDAAAPFYTLLGWKGNTSQSTKKVIDVLSFKNGKPVLGMPIFAGNGKMRSRVVFEFIAQAAMTLKYLPESHTIVFDHLSPADPKTAANPETYGPDMTYCGYKFTQGKWQYTDNLDLRNMPDARDELLTNPKVKP
jgi:hypothetical protein